MGANFLNTMGDIQTLNDGGIGAYQSRVREREKLETNKGVANQLVGDIQKNFGQGDQKISNEDLAALKKAADVGEVNTVTSKYNFLLAKQNKQRDDSDRAAIQQAAQNYFNVNGKQLPPAMQQFVGALVQNPKTADAGIHLLTSQVSQGQAEKRQNVNDAINSLNTSIKEIPAPDKNIVSTQSLFDKARLSGLKPEDISGLDAKGLSARIPGITNPQAKQLYDAMAKTRENLRSQGTDVQPPGIVDQILGGVGLRKPITNTVKPDDFLNQAQQSVIDPKALQEHQANMQQKQQLMQQKNALEQLKGSGAFFSGTSANSALTKTAPQQKMVTVTHKASKQTKQYPVGSPEVQAAQSNPDFDVSQP